MSGPNDGVPAPTPLRMDAYYYGFEPTGVREIDLILCAVASAGKAYHHTESWTDDEVGERPNCEGRTCAEWIQNAANRAAETMRATLEGTPASSGEPAAKPEPKPARAVDVECPTCHAAPGTGCGYADGELFAPGRVHPYRAVAFAAAYEPDDVPPKPAEEGTR